MNGGAPLPARKSEWTDYLVLALRQLEGVDFGVALVPMEPLRRYAQYAATQEWPHADLPVPTMQCDHLAAMTRTAMFCTVTKTPDAEDIPLTTELSSREAFPANQGGPLRWQFIVALEGSAYADDGNLVSVHLSAAACTDALLKQMNIIERWLREKPAAGISFLKPPQTQSASDLFGALRADRHDPRLDAIARALAVRCAQSWMPADSFTLSMDHIAQQHPVLSQHIHEGECALREAAIDGPVRASSLAIGSAAPGLEL